MMFTIWAERCTRGGLGTMLFSLWHLISSLQLFFFLFLAFAGSPATDLHVCNVHHARLPRSICSHHNTFRGYHLHLECYGLDLLFTTGVRAERKTTTSIAHRQTTEFAHHTVSNMQATKKGRIIWVLLESCMTKTSILHFAGWLGDGGGRLPFHLRVRGSTSDLRNRCTLVIRDLY